jgi:pyrimidine-nucleoside phosphorylase
LTLQGKGPADLEELCLYLGGWMLRLAGKAAGLQEGRDKLEKIIESGAALNKFRELIHSQHGDAAVIDDPALLPRAASTLPVPAETGGYVHRLGAEAIGRAALALGAGRENKEDPVDFAVGVILFKKRGDRVFPGDELARLHLNCAPDAPPAETARRLVTNAYEIKPGPADKPQLILGYVDRTGRHYIS